MLTQQECLQYYRDKIRAEIEGRTYVPPAPSASNNSLSRAGSAGSSRSTRVAGNSANDSWDDWGKPSTVKVSHTDLFPNLQCAC